MNIKDKLKVMDEVADANRQHVEKWKEQQDIRKAIKGVLIDTVNGTAEVRVIEKELDSYYKLLNCRCIDIVRRSIAGRTFDIICDDESTLTDDPIPSALSVFGSVMLYGNLFIVQYDGKDDVKSLTDGEIAHVMRNLLKYRLRNDNGIKTSIAVGNVGY